MLSNYDLGDITSRYCKPDLGMNLILNLACSSIYKDPATGEVKAADGVTEEIKIRVNQKQDPDTENTQGSDRDRIYVEGHLVDPLRKNYDLGDRLDGKYLYEGNWVTCSFYPVTKLSSAFTESRGLHDATGRRIAGYLKLERAS